MSTVVEFTEDDAWFAAEIEVFFERNGWAASVEKYSADILEWHAGFVSGIVGKDLELTYGDILEIKFAE